MALNVSVEGQAGPKVIADGGESEIRLTRDASQAMQMSHGVYTEAALRGNLYSLSTAAAGVTVAAANIVAAANSQPIVGIWNPTNSGKTVSIIRCTWSISSGTLGAGGLVWAYFVGTSTGASGLAEVNNFSFVTGGSGVRTYVNTAATGVTSVLLRHIGGPTTGAAAANQNLSGAEETAGSILVPPGVFLGLMAAAAGTSPIVSASMEFEVLPYIA